MWSPALEHFGHEISSESNSPILLLPLVGTANLGDWRCSRRVSCHRWYSDVSTDNYLSSSTMRTATRSTIVVDTIAEPRPDVVARSASKTRHPPCILRQHFHRRRFHPVAVSTTTGLHRSESTSFHRCCNCCCCCCCCFHRRCLGHNPWRCETFLVQNITYSY